MVGFFMIPGKLCRCEDQSFVGHLLLRFIYCYIWDLIVFILPSIRVFTVCVIVCMGWV